MWISYSPCCLTVCGAWFFTFVVRLHLLISSSLRLCAVREHFIFFLSCFTLCLFVFHLIVDGIFSFIYFLGKREMNYLNLFNCHHNSFVCHAKSDEHQICKCKRNGKLYEYLIDSNKMLWNKVKVSLCVCKYGNRLDAFSRNRPKNSASTL